MGSPPEPAGSQPAPPTLEKLVGRDAEYAAVDRALGEARGGSGRVVLLCGEPGIGKTRLAAAIAERAAALALPVLWGRAAELTGAPPYWPWTQILRQWLALSGRATPVALPAARPTELTRILPELGEQVPQAAVASGADGAAAARFRLCEEAAAWLRRGAEAAGQVVVLDDLHWADPPSLELLSHVAADVGNSRLLVICTTRDGPADITPELHRELARMARHPTVLRIQLSGLDDGAVRAHLAAVVGQDVPEALAQQVCDRADGNPFFVGELGRLMKAGEPGSGGLPPGVRDVLELRLAQLPAPTREVLEVAGLMGRTLELDVLASACGSSVSEVLAAVDPAIQRGVLVQGSTAGSLRFAHALVTETLRHLLTPSRSARLHQRIAAAIEATRASTLEDWMATLAAHWSAAAPDQQTSRRTVEVARTAAQQAERRLADADAVPLWRLALSGADRAGTGTAERAELLLGLAGALFRSGDIAESFATCREAAAIGASAGRHDLVAEAALVVEGTGEPEWADALIGLARQALTLLGAGSGAAQLSTRARLHAQIAHALQFTAAPDRLEQARTESAEAVTLAERCGDPRALLAALRSRQLALSGPEGVDERLASAGRTVEIGLRAGDPGVILWGRLWRADALFQLGDLAGVETELGELGSVVDQLRWPVARWHLLRSQTALLTARGRFGEAMVVADEALHAVAGAGLVGAEIAVMAARECIADMVGAMPGDAGLLERRRSLAGHDIGGRGTRVILILNLLREGEREEALAQYGLLPNLDGWAVREYLRMAYLFFRLRAATALGLDSEIEALLTRVRPLAHWHVVAGMISSGGPGFLHVGAAEAALGRHDDAVEHVEQALLDSRRWGLCGWAVIAQVQLAEILARRAGSADLGRVRTLAPVALAEARRLGMRPAAARAQAVQAALPRTATKVEEPTSRELQVAELVAQGLTNRQIAVRLGITERTAETHVAHILSKLRLRNRAQLGAWVSGRPHGREPT